MYAIRSYYDVGHLGLGGVGDTKGLLESEMRERHIRWITNAKVQEVRPGEVVAIEHDAQGQPLKRNNFV